MRVESAGGEDGDYGVLRCVEERKPLTWDTTRKTYN